MLFDLTIIGFGVIGVESLHGIKKYLLERKKANKKKIKIAIIEKNLANIPGGVAYNQKSSKFGFFNNPLRLSHPEFIKWFNLPQNKKKIIEFSHNNQSYNLKTWAKNNESILNGKYNEYKEIYLPRLIYSFYLKEKILQFLYFKKKNNISLKIYKGEAQGVINNQSYNIVSNKFFNEFIFNDKKKKINFKKK